VQWRDGGQPYCAFTHPFCLPFPDFSNLKLGQLWLRIERMLIHKINDKTEVCLKTKVGAKINVYLEIGYKTTGRGEGVYQFLQAHKKNLYC